MSTTQPKEDIIKLDRAGQLLVAPLYERQKVLAEQRKSLQQFEAQLNADIQVALRKLEQDYHLESNALNTTHMLQGFEIVPQPKPILVED
jgi:hypothetical protein